MNVTTIAGTNRPGAMKSTTRIAAASTIAAMTGPNRARSLAVIVEPLPPQPEGDRRGLVDRVERLLHRALDQVEEDPGEQPEDHDEDAERHQRHGLDRPHVREVVAEALEEVRELAERQPLEHPQQVARREDHHERRDR